MMQMEMGGSERLVHNLLLKLDRNIFNPSLAWFFGDRLLKEFKDLDIPLYRVPKEKRIDFSAMRKFGAIIKNNNIHVVNAHHFMSMVYAYYGSKIENRTKLVYTEHSEWEIEQISWKWNIIGSYLLSHTDAAVGVTAAVTKQIQNRFNADASKTITIPNGVDLKALSRNGSINDLREQLGLASDEKVIAITANLKKIKNHIFLLTAFKELLKSYNNIKLLLIGQGFVNDAENTEQELRDYVNEKEITNKVLFLGYRSDISQLLNITDIFCLTSLKEGLPISLIEAMAVGLPVVGTNVEGIRDVIIHNQNGSLVNIGDVESLKNALLILLKNESMRRKYGEKSRSLAKETYSLDHCVKKYQDLYVSMMGDRLSV